jgi:hypothetical protein
MMNLVSIIFVCYFMAAITVFGGPTLIHHGMVAIRNRTGRDWSFLLLTALVLYLMLVMMLLCMGYFMLYVRFIR